MHRQFSNPALAEALLPHAFDARDGAHDEAHLLRVWRNVLRISDIEGGDLEILLAATLLHDGVWIDKGSPQRGMASRFAAEKARNVLSDLGWNAERSGQVCHAIEAHSFSAGIAPQSLEARILQDADRLDSIGFIGVARCFYVAGLRRSSICDAVDPPARHRPLDDSRFALDHFRTKLMTLGDRFCTATGARLAAERSAQIEAFYHGMLAEIG
ncbi:HD domain-containing protein [Salipiger pentaromativorans]|uniref:HD domain-containing protein n=1 Tax=Salipiger pentaromativorans TaxID=2943193 RepID=UPI0021578C04|nr:HD domain-containing protein [Salipiger pentaromativorans]